MPAVVSVDGAIVPRDRAVVSVYDRGFLYGDTIFETLRARGGRPFRLARHLERLARSADLVGIALPVELPELAREVDEALAASAEPDAVVRVTISRGEGPLGIDPSAARDPRRVIFVEPLAASALAAASTGVAVRLVATRRVADLVPEAKVGAYLDAVVAHRAARSHGDGEAVIVDPAGDVVEAGTANVFAVVGTVPRPGLFDAQGVRPSLLTPAEGALLPGITRRLVLDLAASVGVAAVEGRLTASALAAAEEAFLTSSVRGIVPILAVDGAPLGGGAPGPVTRKLQAAHASVFAAETAAPARLDAAGGG